MFLLAQISDTHFDGTSRYRDRAERIMAFVNGLPTPPDAIVVTGDIVDHGLASEYEQAREVLQSPIPMLIGPGNHDDRIPFREVLLGEEASPAPINQSLRVRDVLVLLADSSVPGEPQGALAPETIGWLQAELDQTPRDTRVLIAFHHPPTTLFSPIVDPIKLTTIESLAALVRGDDRIAALLCGHAHTAAATTFAGRPLCIGPSTAATLAPVWESADRPVVDSEVAPSAGLPRPRRHATRHALPDRRELITARGGVAA